MSRADLPGNRESTVWCEPTEHEWVEHKPVTVGATSVWACSRCPLWTTVTYSEQKDVRLRAAAQLAAGIYGTVSASTLGAKP